MEQAMTSKIRIKLGPIEVEYEGSESFLKEELPYLLAAVAKSPQGKRRSSRDPTTPSEAANHRIIYGSRYDSDCCSKTGREVWPATPSRLPARE